MPEQAFATSVSLRRNYGDLPFAPKTQEDAQACVTRALDASQRLQDKYYYYPVRELDDCFLREIEDKWLVPDGMRDKPWAGLLIRRDGKVSITLAESDHLTLRAPLAEDALRAAGELQDIAAALGEGHPYASDPQFGHLTVALRHAGTGVTVTQALHLPVLHMLRQIPSVASGLAQEGRFELNGLKLAKGQEAGALFLLSNRFAQEPTEAMLPGMDAAARTITGRERALRDRIFKENHSRNYGDQVMRSYGILRYARKLPYREFLSHWSNIRLAADVGLIDTDPAAIDRLFWDARPTQVLLAANGQADERAINYLRADMVRARLAGGQ